MSTQKKKKGKGTSGLAIRYHLDDDTEKGRALTGILKTMGVKVVDVQESQLLQKVGYLAGTVGFEASQEVFEGEAPDCELLLLKGFPDPRLTELFTRIRKAEMGSIKRKAVVTETNRQWTLLQLIGEIGKEAEQVE